MTAPTPVFPGNLGMALDDAPTGEVGRLFPYDRAIWMAARVVERMVREGRFHANDLADRGHLHAHWEVSTGGIRQTMVLAGNARNGVLGFVGHKSWDLLHLGSIPWRDFPQRMTRADQDTLFCSPTPLVVKGTLDLGSAHKMLAWEDWCAALHAQGGAL